MLCLLRGERSALNFLQLLSGVASRTALYVAQSGGQTIIKDTRKTIPGLRLAQKYAVRCGGGQNHRRSLADGILIKENNIRSYGSIGKAVEVLRRHHPGKTLEIEVETLTQIEEAIEAQADIVLLDNFSVRDAQKAIAVIDHRVRVEISGGVTLNNIQDYAELGADCISVGTLTRDIKSLDLSMQIQTQETDQDRV